MKETYKYYTREVTGCIKKNWTDASRRSTWMAIGCYPFEDTAEARADQAALVMSTTQSSAYRQLSTPDKEEFLSRMPRAVEAVETDCELTNAKMKEIWPEEVYSFLHLKPGDFDCDISTVLNRKNAMLMLGPAVTAANKKKHEAARLAEKELDTARQEKDRKKKEKEAQAARVKEVASQKIEQCTFCDIKEPASEHVWTGNGLVVIEHQCT